MEKEGELLRQRIIAAGFSIKGFARRLSDKYKYFVISDVTLSRALHHARDGRAERYIRECCDKELKRWEARS